MKQLLMIGFLLSSLISPPSFAADEAAEEKDSADADISQILNSIGYPELQVVPRATERLQMEARSERNSWYYQHWPMQVAGLFTLYVASSISTNRLNLTDKDLSNSNTASTVGSAIGAGWLVAGLIIGAQKPYTAGVNSLSKIKGKDERSELMRERLAEEALEKPARTMRALETISVITNLTVNASTVFFTNDKGKMIAGVGMILSFLPMMFTDHSIDVYERHLDYKKKIFAPIKSASLHFDPSSQTLTPMTNLVWTF